MNTPPDEEIKTYNIFKTLHPNLRHTISTKTHGKITIREQITSIAQRHTKRITLDWDKNNEEKSLGKRKRIKDAT